MSQTTPGPVRPASFQPRFTLSLLYLFAFFFLYALLLVAPELLSMMEPAAEDQRAAIETAVSDRVHAASRGRLLIALLAAVLSVGFGTKYKLLPGLRPSGS